MQSFSELIDLIDTEMHVLSPRMCIILSNEVFHYKLDRQNGILDWHETQVSEKEYTERIKTIMHLGKKNYIKRDQPRMYIVMPFTDEILHYELCRKNGILGWNDAQKPSKRINKQ